MLQSGTPGMLWDKKGFPGNPEMFWDKRDAPGQQEGRWKMLRSQALIPKSNAGKSGIPGSDPKDLGLTVAVEGNIPGPTSLGTGMEQFQPFQNPFGGNSSIPAIIPNLSSPLQTAPGNSWI